MREGGGTESKKGALVSTLVASGQARTRKPPAPVTRPTPKDRAPARPATAAGRLSGVVEGVTYQHPETRYTVLRLTLEPDVPTPGELFGPRGPRERLVYAVGKAGE